MMVLRANPPGNRGPVGQEDGSREGRDQPTSRADTGAGGFEKGGVVNLAGGALPKMRRSDSHRSGILRRRSGPTVFRHIGGVIQLYRQTI